MSARSNQFSEEKEADAARKQEYVEEVADNDAKVDEDIRAKEEASRQGRSNAGDRNSERSGERRN